MRRHFYNPNTPLVLGGNSPQGRFSGYNPLSFREMPYYLGTIAPVLVLALGLVSAGFYGWLVLAVLILSRSKIIWWATERAWGKFSYTADTNFFARLRTRPLLARTRSANVAGNVGSLR